MHLPFQATCPILNACAWALYIGALMHAFSLSGDLSDILRLDLAPSNLGQPQFLALKDFESGSALDSALALVEHLMEGS